MVRYSFLISLMIWVPGVLSSLPPPERLTGMNPCISKQTCHECIQTPHCAWCAAPKFNEKRCFLPNINTKIFATCPEEFTWNPDNVFSMVRHRNLTKGGYVGVGEYSGSSFSSSSSSSSWSSKSSSSSSSSASGNRQDAVQIWPQEVNLKLRINEAHRMSFAYSQAEDYPVDLYYLMDLSKSMEDDKQKLSDLGQLLVESMSKITSNFRLGFGSFVDKVVMPYVSTIPKALKEPCDGCAAPYGYKNVMRLSTDTSEFASLVSNASVSGNLDAPEGGFDAIMQAIVCRNEIGWREKARRLLVFSTDAGFHFAGDGKLGGIIRPNDGLCHLDHTGLYTHSSLQDYPSISQINLKVKQNAINIIWAVTEEQISVYKRLTKHVEGSFAGKLSNDSSNIVELIREQYDKISSSVEMKDTASSVIKVRYLSSCLNDGPLIETSKCDGLKVGTKVEFIAEIEVTSCPANRSEWKQKFDIYPVGINETLTVNLEMLCDCQCEHSGPMYEAKSPECNGVGTLKCGVCECYDGFFGKRCECSSHQEITGFDRNFQSCRPDNTSLVDCSGRGTCACGQCECEERENHEEIISGHFCECDNFSCDRDDGYLCSNHGTCQCGQCICNAGWTGPSCRCRSSNDTCIAPGTTNGVLCSGHGDCVCGECICHEVGNIRYSGKHCNKCPTCPSRCEELKPCVQCLTYKTGNLTESECNKLCTEFVPETVESIVVDVDNDEVACYGIDEYDCKYNFVYYYDNQNCLKVKVQAERECPSPVYVLGIVLGVIAAIVLIGLAFLLLWKLLTTIHDRREFAKFERERMMAKWDTGENPIYKQATSTFKNPTYAGK
ncbi:integrin beta-PS [Chelonus insularis]|uniref:integrin beta-PS n=1 Tax=Chelonus insularis TaxID=460826 RepID=UPI00158E4AD0|nr:integrin beta-PS [Chelonus insularis]XP_034949318.1 integrin beta-PS [Chelonus insularis]XP_034949319.1 integrin beta-PS [Chelonus insularis]XP_034949320.1 integrin beta-PS [Chelonus insularis]